MISKISESFRRDFARLPARIQERARSAYARFCTDPFHKSLEFKHLGTRLPIWSVRITADYRAVGVRDGETITWFFIGTHADYDKLLARLL